MNKTTLLPCPFCGGVAILDREDIFCDDCNASISIWDKLYNKEAENYTEAKTQAINIWNKRANIEYPEALKKQLPQKARDISSDGIERYVCDCGNLMHRKQAYCEECGQRLEV